MAAGLAALPVDDTAAQGAAMSSIERVSVFGRQQNNTYGLGDEITIAIGFSNPVTLSYTSERTQLTLALEMGDRTLQLPVRRCVSPIGGGIFACDSGELLESLKFEHTVGPDDYAPDGIRIGADALQSNGTQVLDQDGNAVDLSLAGHAIARYRNRVDGSLDHPPRLLSVTAHGPDEGDVFRNGETITMSLYLDEDVIARRRPGGGDPSLTIRIGSATRVARWSVPYGVNEYRSSYQEIGEFTYEVQPLDFARSIVVVAFDANGWTIRDEGGIDAVVGQALPRAVPGYDVDGGEGGGMVEAVGTLPPLELVAGGPPVTVDLAPAFRGHDFTLGASSSHRDVAHVQRSGALLTVTPLSVGVATVRVVGRAEREYAVQEFNVRVVRDPADVRAIEASLAALGRSLLASVTTSIEARFAAEPERLSVAGLAVSAGIAAARTGMGPSRFSAPPVADADTPHHAARTRSAALAHADMTRRTGGDLLRGSHMALALTSAQAEGGRRQAPQLTVWGSGDLQTFAGELEAVADYSGDLRTGHVGVDISGASWLAGVSVSHGAGEASLRTTGVAGRNVQVATTLTSAQPYLRWKPGEGREVWMILGRGAGMLTSRHEGEDKTYAADLSMWLGVVGARETLVSGGPAEIVLRGDVGLVGLETPDGDSPVQGRQVTVQRSRVGVELSHALRWESGVTLRPFGAVGFRHDGGDGQTGNGMELEAGVRLADPWTGIGLDVRGRMLALHTTGQYREHGVSVTALWTPGGTVDRGLSVSVAPRWGAPAGGTDSLWREQVFGRHHPGAPAPDDGGLDGRIGYGLRLAAGGTVTPFTELGVAGPDYRRLRVGLRVTGTEHARWAAIELTGDRVNSGWRPPEHRFGAFGRLRF